MSKYHTVVEGRRFKEVVSVYPRADGLVYSAETVHSISEGTPSQLHHLIHPLRLFPSP